MKAQQLFLMVERDEVKSERRRTMSKMERLGCRNIGHFKEDEVNKKHIRKLIDGVLPTGVAGEGDGQAWGAGDSSPESRT